MVLRKKQLISEGRALQKPQPKDTIKQSCPAHSESVFVSAATELDMKGVNLSLQSHLAPLRAMCF